MKVLLTGSRGMLGSTILDCLPTGLTIDSPSRTELDLLKLDDVYNYISNSLPNVIIHVAAKVGGIQANLDHPFEFITENLQMDLNVLTTAHKLSIPKLFYIGSTCMYPKNQNLPFIESDVLSGKLEPTNEGYALAKIAGAKIVELAATTKKLSWRILIPSNLYGPRDNFDPNGSHLIAAIVRKVDTAIHTNSPSIQMWGDGNSRREFTFVGDVAKFICESLEVMDSLPIRMNLGTGIDHSVRDFYEIVSSLMDYRGSIVADLTRPNGMRRKLGDSSLAFRHGWNPRTNLEDGLAKTIEWFRENERG